jgi:predicted  nucleic acid-binding Zn-ribbon protein
MPAKDDAPVTRAELKEVLAEFADRIINRFESSFKEIDRRFDESQSQMADLQSQMADLQSQMADLQSQMAEMRKRLEKVEAELFELQKQQERVVIDLGVLRAEIVSLEDRLKHVEAGLERVVLTLFNFENRDDIRTEQIAKMMDDHKKLNGRFILAQSEMAEFKAQYSPERVHSEIEEVRRTTRRLEERVAALEKNRAGASVA